MTDAEFQKLVRNDLYQTFLFTCFATVPFCFARHPWFVVNKKGKLSRWEIFWEPGRGPLSWQHLHRDFHPLAQGIEMFFYSDKHFFPSRLEGYIEGSDGSLAARMAEHIEHSPQAYPYNTRYSLTAPNSITYVQSILDAFPKCNLHLPWNCYTWAFGVKLSG